MRRLFIFCLITILTSVFYAQTDTWTPIIETVDGFDMVQVPAGCFIMGSDTGYPDEAPAHEVCIESSFWIDRYAVSNEQAADFGAEIAPASDIPDAPRTNIMWIEAQHYCEARGGRLPTEAEWAYAARGQDYRTYPWGDDFDADYANTCDAACNDAWRVAEYDDGYGQVAPVDAFVDGASWVGAVGMSGNVWEWTNTAYDPARFPYPYRANDGREAAQIEPESLSYLRVIRGGAWDDLPDGVRISIRSGRYSYYDTGANIGFRCVRDTN